MPELIEQLPSEFSALPIVLNDALTDNFASPETNLAVLAATESVDVNFTPIGPDRLSLRDWFCRSRLGRLAIGGLAYLGLAAGGVAVEAGPAHADTGYVYTVIGTDGDGAWLHGDPGFGDKGDLVKVMPEGTRFTADCYVIDDPVGPRSNPVWLHGTDGSSTGYFTDYYSSSHWDRNNTLKDQGLPLCGKNPGTGQNQGVDTPALVNVGDATVFYSPGTMGSPADVTLHAEGSSSRWTGQNCATDKADDFPEVISGKPVTTLAGWSIGRLGPMYFLEQVADGQKRDNIKQIILFDPGSKAEYERNVCDQRYDQSALLAKWLGESTTHHLTILAGEVTDDKSHPSANHGHAGIQNVLFPDIRGKAIKDQVLVCNYVYAGTDRDLSHRDTYSKFSYLLGQSPSNLTSCPAASGVDLQAGWRP